jgi:preprotein translocase SecE subunit
MKRVVWPHRPEVINSSMVVLVTLVFFVILTFTVDSLVVQALRLISQISVG